MKKRESEIEFHSLHSGARLVSLIKYDVTNASPCMLDAYNYNHCTSWMQLFC